MAGQKLILRDDSGAEHEIEIQADGTAEIAGRAINVRPIRPGEVRAGDRPIWVADDGQLRWTFVDGEVYTFDTAPAKGRARRSADHEGGLSAPMPATVVSIKVSPGDAVRAGDVVMILEAMKMELPVRSAADGVVAAVRCKEGDLVQPGTELIEIVPGKP
jgi:acetyl/propionyl-CoA carboxylase alpha subunit